MTFVQVLPRPACAACLSLRDSRQVLGTADKRAGEGPGTASPVRKSPTMAPYRAAMEIASEWKARYNTFQQSTSLRKEKAACV